jgi:hypothetical protein
VCWQPTHAWFGSCTWLCSSTDLAFGGHEEQLLGVVADAINLVPILHPLEAVELKN